MAFLQSSSPDDALDVSLMFPGDRFPVIAGPGLRASGWRGGQFVSYVAGGADFLVEISDGLTAAGFMLFQAENYTPLQPGSDGVSPNLAVGSTENWLSHQFRGGEGGYNVGTMVNGGTRAFFKVYETIALGGGVRAGGAITYSVQDELKVSENGLLCNDSDAQMNAAGIATPIVVGIVSAVPSSQNGNRLCIDMKY
jgi:hypothetical protein